MSNENKNNPQVSPEKLKALGILKILNVVISDEDEDLYVCILEDGSKKNFLASELLE